MIGFIEITRRDNHEKELINTSAIVSVFKNDIMTIGRQDNGFHVQAYIIPCEETYVEIIDMIERSQY